MEDGGPINNLQSYIIGKNALLTIIQTSLSGIHDRSSQKVATCPSVDHLGSTELLKYSHLKSLQDVMQAQKCK
jgi:hypothetical protein